MLMMIAPLARSPMERKAAQALADYGKALERALDDVVPWQKSPRRNAYLRRKGKIKSGEVKVILDPGEAGDIGLYDGAKIVRE